MQDHLPCLVSLRPTLAFLNGTRVTEEDVRKGQLWAEGHAAAASASQPLERSRDHVKEGSRPGEPRPSLTPSSITFEDVWSGGFPQPALPAEFLQPYDILSNQGPS